MKPNQSFNQRFLQHSRHPVRAARLVGDIVEKFIHQKQIHRDKTKFWETAHAVVSDLEQPILPKGVAVFMDCGFMRDGAMYSLVMRALNGRGWHVASLLDGLPMRPVLDERLNFLDGVFKRVSATEYILRKDVVSSQESTIWQVDLENGLCQADGIDYFPIIMGKLRRLFKAYDLDFQQDDVKQAVDEVLKSAKNALSVCYYLRDNIATRGIPVRILGAEHLYVPAGIFMMFCAEEGYRYGIEFVDFSGAYSHYFTAGEYLERQSYAVQNITRRKTISRHIVNRGEFDRWINKGQDAAAALKKAQQLILQNWTGNEKRPAGAEELIERIRLHRKGGGTVACAFGHVGFDLSVPRDHGDAHKDMIDWLNDTITTLNDTNTLLLIKPHPTEKRFKPNRGPNQLLEELIGVPRSKNIVMLDALWFNAFEIFEFIDVGLVWRSNVALELSIAGIPAIVAGTEAAYRYAVDLIYPSDPDNYHDLLDNLKDLTALENQRERCALYLKYIAEETFIHLPYIDKPGFRESHGFRYVTPTLKWNMAALKTYQAKGDPAIERVCAEIIS